MTTTLIASLLSILCVFFELVFSKESKDKRKDEKLDEAFANKDTDSIAPELDYYYRMLKEKDRNSTGRKADN
jgi:hypothetical protein